MYLPQSQQQAFQFPPMEMHVVPPKQVKSTIKD